VAYTIGELSRSEKKRKKKRKRKRKGEKKHTCIRIHWLNIGWREVGVQKNEMK